MANLPKIEAGQTLSDFVKENPGAFPYLEQYDIPKLSDEFVITDVTFNYANDRVSYTAGRQQITVTVFDYEVGSYGIDTEDATVNNLTVNGFDAVTVEKYYEEEELNTNRVILIDQESNLLIDVFGMRVELPYLMEIAEGVRKR